MWGPHCGLTSLPMVVQSSQPKETKWEKCKCKCWEGPGGQGIADPFDDLTKEIGSRDVREQAPCVQKNQKVNHQSWIPVTWKSLCFAPKCLRVARSNVGLGLSSQSSRLARIHLGRKDNKARAACCPQNILQPWGVAQLLEIWLHPDLKMMGPSWWEPWLPTGQGWGTGGPGFVSFY